MRGKTWTGTSGAAASVSTRTVAWLTWACRVGLAALLLWCAEPKSSAVAEPLPDGLRLVMVEDAACSYCRKWLAEVGPFYATSLQGRRAPLVRRQVGDASLGAFGRLVYTPTFLLVRDGREIDRLVGYGGAGEFWRQLRAMLAKADGGAPGEAPNGAPGDEPPTPPDLRPSEGGERDAGLGAPGSARAG